MGAPRDARAGSRSALVFCCEFAGGDASDPYPHTTTRCRTYRGEPTDQVVRRRDDGWPTSRLVRWLCPVSGDPLFVPSQDSFGFHDQKRVASMCPTHCRPKEGKDGPVGLGELWSVDLTLQDQDLVAQCEDLCVTGVACGKNRSESVENKANQRRNRVTSAEGYPRERCPKPA